MKNLFSLIVLCAYLVSYKTWANCHFELSLPSVSYTVTDINPTVSQNFSLYRHSGGPDCDNYTLGFSKGNSSTYNRVATNALSGATINYNIYKTSAAATPLQKLADASSINQVLSGAIDKKETLSLEYYFKLDNLSSTSIARGGVYTDTLQVEASPGVFSDAEAPESTYPLVVNIVVPKNISISLVDSGAVHDGASTSKVLDFGELTENEEMAFDVRVVSNAGFSLSVSSSNNQQLEIDGGANGGNGRIAYDFYSSNTAKNLSTSSTSPVAIGSGSGSTPAQGVGIPVRVVIKSVENKLSGTYKDYVTFTVATTE